MTQHSFGRRHSVRISGSGRAVTYATVALTWATGAAWLLLHHFFQRQGEFGLAPHPAEPWMMKLHGAGAFAALWLGGALWSSHVTRAWRQHRRPVSGIAVASVLGILIASGYLLYYAGGDVLRARVALVHWVIGILLPVALIGHVAARRK